MKDHSHPDFQLPKLKREEMTLPARVAPRYSIDELLKLRDSLPVVSCIIDNINKHPDIGKIFLYLSFYQWLISRDIGAIFRVPDQALNDPKHFSCHSKTLANITNRRKFSQGSRHHVIESSSEESEFPMSSTGTNIKRDSRQMQWNLRRRDDSDRSSQPHSAPTGFAAQQSENFQRFYRAVVSPTHVRVTAGGRIVPNTRSPASAPSQLEWSSDKLFFEPSRSTSEYESSNQPAPWLQNSVVTNAFAAAPPYNLVPQTDSLSTMAAHTQPGINGTAMISHEASRAAKITDDTLSGTAQPVALPQPIKISPPSQFDQSKPFVYNGQLVYPVPQGFQPPASAISALPMAVPMLGNPGFLPQPQLSNPTGFLPAQFPAPLTPISNPFMFPAGQQLPVMMPNFMQPENKATMLPCLPMRGMALPAEVLATHLQFLRNQVKICDHQLANNKHQIDEVMMQNQRTVMISQIGNLEMMLNVQTVQGGLSSNGVSTDYKSYGLGTSAGQTVEIPSQTSLGFIEKPFADHTAKNTSMESTKADTSLSLKTEPVTKSRLSLTAALAPPFQPRSQALILASQAQQAFENDEFGAADDRDDFETQAQIEARLLSKATSDWETAGPSTTTTAPPSLCKALTLYDAPVHDQTNDPVPTFQRANTFHGQTYSSSSSALMPHTPTVPYLVGTLPHGVHASLAKPTDFIYSRPLTDDELRARYLYWGKAPRSVQSGLPKFDGKDFYPPSPVKKNKRASTVNYSTTSSAESRESTVAMPSFEDLFMEPGVPGYKTPSPVRPQHSVRDLIPVPQPVFTNGTKGCILASSCINYDDAGEDAPVKHWSPSLAGPIKESDLDEFSNLFTERGVPGYKSPTTKINEEISFGNSNRAGEVPVTPKHLEFPEDDDCKEDDIQSVDSWEQNNGAKQAEKNESDIIVKPESEHDARSRSSSVVIHLSPQSRILSPKSAHEKAFVERVENFRR